MTLSEARTLLETAGVFFGPDDEEPDGESARMLNLNDAFFWGCADGEVVSDDEMPEVARLFLAYGMCGIYYWVCTKRGYESVGFSDINRFVQFVRMEEEICKECPDWNKRAYHTAEYHISA